MVELPDLTFEIIYNGQDYPVSFAPIGWDSLSIDSELDDIFLTTWSKINTNLQFVLDGADILRKIMYANGANVSASLRIKKKDRNGWNYKERVFANFDFQKFSDINSIVSIGLLENDVAANIRTFIDVQYSIPVDATTGAIDMNIGGIGIGEGATFVDAVDATGIGGFNAFLPTVSISDNTVVGTTIVELNSEYDPATIFLGDTSTFSYNWFMKVNAPTNFNMRVTGNVQATGAGLRQSQMIQFMIYDDLGRKYFLGTQYVHLPPIPHQSLINLDFDINVPVETGRKYTFVMYSDKPNVGSDTYSFQIDQLNLTIDYSTYTIDYKVKGLRAYDLFYQLMKRINPNVDLNISAPVLQQGLGHRIVVASGNNIRGIFGATIQTSFSEFLMTFLPQLFAGFKVYDDKSIKFDILNNIQFNMFSLAGNLGVIRDAKYESITQDYAGKYTIGYDDQQYEIPQGKDEFNTEEDRTVQGSLATNDVEIKSFYRADPRGVDQLIIDFRADTTVDTKGDTQNFQFVVRDVIDEDGFWHLVGPEIYASVTGTAALGRIYNLEITPLQMMLRNSARIAVQFALLKQGVVNFESSKKNAGLVVTYFDGTILSEQAAITYQQMNAPLYLPIKCTFTAVMTDDEYDSVISNANNSGGYVTFTDIDKLREGFIVKSSYNLTGDNIKEFVVYLTTRNILI